MDENTVVVFDQYSYIAGCVKDGMTLKEAAFRFGYSESYVRQICTKAGVHKPKFNIIPERKEKIMQLHKCGMTVEEIKDRLGYSNTTMISACIRKNGEKPVTNTQREREKRDALIIEYRQKNWSYKRIAEKIGVAEATVSDVCDHAGLGGNIVGNIGTGEKRVCPRCGTVFECAPTHNKKYCSGACQRMASHEIGDITRRIRKKNAKRDEGITLKAIYERDHGVCHICGKQTDWKSYKIINGKKCVYGDYPSRDHVIPLFFGGTDTWDNVKLACFSCNARKGVRKLG